VRARRHPNCALVLCASGEDSVLRHVRSLDSLHPKEYSDPLIFGSGRKSRTCDRVPCTDHCDGQARDGPGNRAVVCHSILSWSVQISTSLGRATKKNLPRNSQTKSAPVENPVSASFWRMLRLAVPHVSPSAERRSVPDTSPSSIRRTQSWEKRPNAEIRKFTVANCSKKLSRAFLRIGQQ